MPGDKRPKTMSWIQETPGGVILKVLVQPKGSRNEIIGLQDDKLKVKLTAPPVEGAANKLCVDFLAKSLKVRKSDVEILSGYKGKSKRLIVRSALRKDIEALLAKKIKV